MLMPLQFFCGGHAYPCGSHYYALAMLEVRAKDLDKVGRTLCQVTLFENCAKGTFFAPRACKLDTLDMLEHEL